MAIKDLPDYTRAVVVAVEVEAKLVLPEPSSERAAGGVGSKTTTSADYQEVVKWTVAALKIGELKEILFLSSDYTLTVLQITVGAILWATGWSPQASMPIIFEDLRLATGAVVLVEAKSSTGASITVDAIIVGKEIG